MDTLISINEELFPTLIASYQWAGLMHYTLSILDPFQSNFRNELLGAYPFPVPDYE